MNKDKLKELEELPFEKALEQLEKTVGKMEDGNMPLEEMIRSFEEGTMLARVCGKKLKAIEKKIEILVKEDGRGGQWQEFAPNQTKNQTRPSTGPTPEKDKKEDDDQDEASLF